MPVESRVQVVSDTDRVELGPLKVDDRHDDVSVAAASALNGGSSVAVNLPDLDVDAVKPVGTRLLLLLLLVTCS